MNYNSLASNFPKACHIPYLANNPYIYGSNSPSSKLPRAILQSEVNMKPGYSSLKTQDYIENNYSSSYKPEKFTSQPSNIPQSPSSYENYINREIQAEEERKKLEHLQRIKEKEDFLRRKELEHEEEVRKKRHEELVRQAKLENEQYLLKKEMEQAKKYNEYSNVYRPVYDYNVPVKEVYDQEELEYRERKMNYNNGFAIERAPERHDEWQRYENYRSYKEYTENKKANIDKYIEADKKYEENQRRYTENKDDRNYYKDYREPQDEYTNTKDYRENYQRARENPRVYKDSREEQVSNSHDLSRTRTSDKGIKEISPIVSGSGQAEEQGYNDEEFEESRFRSLEEKKNNENFRGNPDTKDRFQNEKSPPYNHRENRTDIDKYILIDDHLEDSDKHINTKSSNKDRSEDIKKNKQYKNVKQEPIFEAAGSKKGQKNNRFSEDTNKILSKNRNLKTNKIPNENYEEKDEENDEEDDEEYDEKVIGNSQKLFETNENFRARQRRIRKDLEQESRSYSKKAIRKNNSRDFKSSSRGNSALKSRTKGFYEDNYDERRKYYDQIDLRDKYSTNSRSGKKYIRSTSKKQPHHLKETFSYKVKSMNNQQYTFPNTTLTNKSTTLYRSG